MPRRSRLERFSISADERSALCHEEHRPRRGISLLSPQDSPALRIPLLSDEECRARGIEPVRFPPRETWTQEQRDAADRLVEILGPHVYLEALYVIVADLEREGTDSKLPESEMEKEAAKRGIALIDEGNWKQRNTWVHFPPSWIRQILEMFVQGDLSLIGPTPPKTRRKGARSRARSSTPRSTR